MNLRKIVPWTFLVFLPLKGTGTGTIPPNQPSPPVQNLNGVATNLTIFQGSYCNFYFTNGSFLRTNNLPPFDWEFHDTNAIVKYGTNTVLKIQISPVSGLVSTVGSVVGNTMSAGGLSFQVNGSGAVSATSISAGVVHGTTVTGDGSGLTSLQAANIVGGVTTNLQFTFNNTRTNTLYFTNGILMEVSQP